MQGMTIRKLADYSAGGNRVTGFHPLTGEKTLIDPETNLPAPWPLLGIVHVGDVPDQVRISQSYVAQAVAEGWVVGTGYKLEHAPGGPPENPWRDTHTFITYKSLTFKFSDGDVKFGVVSNPGKSDDGVDWTYVLHKEA